MTAPHPLHPHGRESATCESLCGLYTWMAWSGEVQWTWCVRTNESCWMDVAAWKKLSYLKDYPSFTFKEKLFLYMCVCVCLCVYVYIYIAYWHFFVFFKILMASVYICIWFLLFVLLPFILPPPLCPVLFLMLQTSERKCTSTEAVCENKILWYISSGWVFVFVLRLRGQTGNPTCWLVTLSSYLDRYLGQQHCW